MIQGKANEQNNAMICKHRNQIQSKVSNLVLEDELKNDNWQGKGKKK